MARKNIAIDQKVYDEIVVQAQKQNETLFAFANESLSLVAKVVAEGGNPKLLDSMWKTISVLREFDVITLPADFVDELVSRLYNHEKDLVPKMFSELGAKLVPFLKTVSEDLAGLAELAKDFAQILPLKRLDITEKGRGVIEVLVVGAGRKIESTGCMAEFIKAILNGYQYSVAKQELSVGVIRIIAIPRGTY